MSKIFYIDFWNCKFTFTESANSLKIIIEKVRICCGGFSSIFNIFYVQQVFQPVRWEKRLETPLFMFKECFLKFFTREKLELEMTLFEVCSPYSSFCDEIVHGVIVNEISCNRFAKTSLRWALLLVTNQTLRILVSC